MEPAPPPVSKPIPSKTHPSIQVTGPSAPKDERALRARLLLTKFMQSAEPVPKDYKPDETVTEDGSEPPKNYHLSGVQAVVPPSHQGRFDSKRSRFDSTRSREQPRAPPPPSQRGNYAEPEWAHPPEHRYFFNVYQKKELSHRIELSSKSHFIIGRMTNCDIQIMDQSLSRWHAVIQHGREGVFVYDCGSTHGTYVNDHKEMQNDGLLPKRKYKRVLATDIIMFGNCPLYYVLEGGETRQQYEERKKAPKKYPEQRVQTFPDIQQQMHQFPDPSNEDNRRRERDYNEGPGYDRGRQDIKAARDHFRERFQNMT